MTPHHSACPSSCRRWLATGATILYLALAAFYFWGPTVPYKLVWPVGFLTVASALLLPWEAVAAFGLCAVGDWMGQCHNFIGQMGFFAAGHVMFIVYFVRRTRAWHRDWRVVPLLLVAVGMVAWSCLTIVPCVSDDFVRMGVTDYTILIVTMAYMACRQSNGLMALGGLAFVVSDSVLAYNKFVANIPHSGLLIMTTYYAAILLLFCGMVCTKQR